MKPLLHYPEPVILHKDLAQTVRTTTAVPILERALSRSALDGLLQGSSSEPRRGLELTPSSDNDFPEGGMEWIAHVGPVARRLCRGSFKGEGEKSEGSLYDQCTSIDKTLRS